jgi:PTS system nitrogen regulatory IIA component
MEIAEVLKPDQVVSGLHVHDKTELLRTLADYASRATGVPAGAILKPLTTREACGSTGTGQGIAIPHATIQGLKRPFAFFAQLEHPIDFESVDGEPVDLVFLLLTTTATSSQNVATLAAISRRLRDRAVLDDLRTSNSAEGIHSCLTSRR